MKQRDLSPSSVFFIFLRPQPFSWPRPQQLHSFSWQGWIPQKFIEVPAQHVSAFLNNVTAAARSKMLVLELFLEGFHLHVLDTLGRTHESRSPNKSRKFVHGIKDLFHLKFRRHIAAARITMADDSVDEFSSQPFS